MLKLISHIDTCCNSILLNMFTSPSYVSWVQSSLISHSFSSFFFIKHPQPIFTKTKYFLFAHTKKDEKSTYLLYMCCILVHRISNHLHRYSLLWYFMQMTSVFTNSKSIIQMKRIWPAVSILKVYVVLKTTHKNMHLLVHRNFVLHIKCAYLDQHYGIVDRKSAWMMFCRWHICWVQQ